MGRTFLARDQKLGRRVVIKTLRPGFSSSAVIVRRFAREVRILASLNHANIVKLITADLSARDPWFAMEYCKKGDLNALRGSTPWHDVLQLIVQACDGIEFAHKSKRGVIHRDIKPSNILLGEDGLTKVADFGLAYFQKRDSTSLTASEQTLGTFKFMAPEQIRGSKHVGPPADVYSLGATLLFVLNGQYTDEFQRHGQLRCRKVPATVKEHISYILSSALAHDQEHRATLEDFRSELQKALANP